MTIGLPKNGLPVPPGGIQVLLKHLCCWALFIAYEVSFVYLTSGGTYHLLNYICYYALNIILFYVHAHGVMDYAFRFRRAYLLACLLILAEILVYLSIKYLLDLGLMNHAAAITAFRVHVQKLLILNLFRGVYFIGFSTLYWSVRRMLRFHALVNTVEKQKLTVLKEKAELEQALSESRNAYLQQQIKPHFLFNALNFIYNSFYKHSAEAGQCVLMLSEIMHYSLDRGDEAGKCPLSEEIQQINNLIAINRLRYDYPLYLRFKVSGKIKHCQIIPLILLTLTENLFKHGYLKAKQYPAKLEIHVDAQQLLTFRSWNLKKNRSQQLRSHKIGMENVFKRLEYSYPAHYDLKIDDAEESYSLELKLQL